MELKLETGNNLTGIGKTLLWIIIIVVVISVVFVAMAFLFLVVMAHSGFFSAIISVLRPLQGV